MNLKCPSCHYFFLRRPHFASDQNLKTKRWAHQSEHKPLKHLGGKLKEMVFYVMLAKRRMYVERRVTKAARTNHPEVYRVLGTPSWKMENSCSLFLTRNQAQHVKICIPPQLKFNSVPLRRAQCVGHRNNSVWTKTDTRKNCRGWSNALENLPEQSAEAWKRKVRIIVMGGSVCCLCWETYFG